MKGFGFAILWAYLKEFLLASIMFCLALSLIGAETLSHFIDKTGAEWAGLTGVLFAASLAIWVAFVNITATDFGDYLRTKNALSFYSSAFVAALFAFFLSTAILIISTGFANVIFSNIALFCLIYAMVNIVTMVRNATGLIRMYAVFKDAIEKAKSQQQ